jgi:pyoverdine/dityrosine biosynthesis protein Dit1
MAKKSEGHVTSDALQIGINNLNDYCNQLKIFYEKTNIAFDELGETNKDQKYDEFANYFDAFFPELEKFRNDIEVFIEFLERKKKFIEGEYADVAIKKK